MADRGDLGSTSFEAHMLAVERKFRMLVALGMGCAPERITRCAFVNVDEAMPGRVGLEVLFDPDLTHDEHAAFRRLITTLMSMLGSRPPIFPGEA